MPETTDNPGNGTKVHIPTMAFLAAFVAIAGYSVKVNNDLLAVAQDTTRILERMDQRMIQEWPRTHAAHDVIIRNQRVIIDGLNRNGR